MANKFAWASLNENGKTTGGKVGDQTGNEVKIGELYDFGQTIVIRFKNRKKARMASLMAWIIAKDNKVGYGQDLSGGLASRAGLANECARIDFDVTKIRSIDKCNADCSSFCAQLINLAFGKRIVQNFTTATMVSETVIKYPQKFEKLKYTKGMALKKGDFLLAEGNHVIINI